MHRLGDLGPDALDALQLLDAGLEQRLDRAVVVREQPGDRAADVLDAERVQEAIEPRLRLALIAAMRFSIDFSAKPSRPARSIGVKA
jgi:hypothetical protein